MSTQYSAAGAAPDYSVLWENRLAMLVWRRQGGHLVRAGTRKQKALAALQYAELVSYDRSHEDLLLKLANESPDLDALLFRLGVEGFRVVEGPVTPHHGMRRL